MAFGTQPTGEAKYQRVADRIRAAIQSGALRPGQALPTEKQLAEEYRVSRPTVRAALGTLRAEGLIDAHQGRGAFVRLRPTVRRVRAPLRTTPQPEREPSDHLNARHQITEAAPAPVWGTVADLLQMTDGDQAFVQRRVVTTPEGEPLELGAHYFPFVQRPADRPSARTVSLLSARMPSPAEAATLRLAEGVPLLEVLVASYDADDVPIQVVERLLPADRYAIYDEQPSGRTVSTHPVDPPEPGTRP